MPTTLRDLLEIIEEKRRQTLPWLPLYKLPYPAGRLCHAFPALRPATCPRASACAGIVHRQRSYMPCQSDSGVSRLLPSHPCTHHAKSSDAPSSATGRFAMITISSRARTDPSPPMFRCFLIACVPLITAPLSAVTGVS